MRVALCFALFLALAAAQDVEESFTVFLDLNDFHLTQLDHHEFLHTDAIGEHDNVLLELSEGEVQHLMAQHDTFSCDHPEDLHEVVSFLQEAMWEPSAPASAASPASVPANLLPEKTELTLTVAPDEKEAVTRFLDAYHAWKYLNKAVDGLGDGTNAPAASSASPLALASTSGGTEVLQAEKPAAKPASLWESLMDEDDKRLLSMFTNRTPQPMQAQSDNLISKLVDQAFKSAFSTPSTASAPASSPLAMMMGIDSSSAASSTPNVETPAVGVKKHHHHHHQANPEPENSPSSPAASAPAAAAVPATEESLATPSASSTNADGFTSEETAALKEILHDLAHKKATPEAQTAPAPAAQAPLETASTPSSSSASSATAAESAEVKIEAPATPSAPTSHIEKAPTPAEVIPESVYSQQLVDFNEKPTPVTHHVPKRILIPRMEEPGPVIGGGSRPVHITIPPLDYDAPLPQPVRPSAPSMLSPHFAEGGAKGESNKPSTVASENDEALTAPEVVIF